jgi:hypothetical protein
MRMQLTIPPELETRLRQLAILEHRDPRRQAEVILYRAIQRASGAPDTPLLHETTRRAEWDVTGRSPLATGPRQPLPAQAECKQTAAVCGEGIEKA